MQRPCLAGIAGPSCSGKTEISSAIARATGAPVLNLDHYYLDRQDLPLEERARQNFDEPSALDAEFILAQVAALARGEAVHAPRYNFTTHSRETALDPVVPGPLVVVEGLFALYWPEVRRHFQLSVYVETPDAVCYARRLERDVRERGRTPESVREQYETTVRPMADLYVRPSAQFADLIVSGADPVQRSAAEVLARLKSLCRF